MRDASCSEAGRTAVRPYELCDAPNGGTTRMGRGDRYAF